MPVAVGQGVAIGMDQGVGVGVPTDGRVGIAVAAACEELKVVEEVLADFAHTVVPPKKGGGKKK